jgi:large subunit ribosomal protein L6
MSRLGKRPVKIPSGVKVNVSGTTVSVEGPKGKLSRTFPAAVKIEVKADEISFGRMDETKETKSAHGMVRQLLSNMVDGAAKSFTKTLVTVGVGYRMAIQGKKLTLSLGFSHPVVFDLPEGVSGAVADQTKLTLTAADKELLGKTADTIRKFRPPEPYKGKGVRYDGEQIQLKEGKAAAK